MPRKVTKTAKPSLQFLERPLCGAKLQNVPEVRAALNARDFFTEAEAQSSSALNSWVSCNEYFLKWCGLFFLKIISEHKLDLHMLEFHIIIFTYDYMDYFV